MKKTILMTIFILLVISVLPAMAQNQNKPIQVSLFNPIQIFSEDTPIGGIRFNFLYGKNTTVSGLDFGLVNHTTAGLSKGYQFGLVGMTEADFLGFQNNVVNYTKGGMEGFQWGVVNYAGKANGFQLGLVNYAENMKGLQIGLINIIKNGGQFPVFPIVNWSF